MSVGDDLYTTNTDLIKQGIEHKWANALLLKVNQIGTISEAMDAARLIYGALQTTECKREKIKMGCFLSSVHVFCLLYVYYYF